MVAQKHYSLQIFFFFFKFKCIISVSIWKMLLCCWASKPLQLCSEAEKPWMTTDEAKKVEKKYGSKRIIFINRKKYWCRKLIFTMDIESQISVILCKEFYSFSMEKSGIIVKRKKEKMKWRKGSYSVVPVDVSEWIWYFDQLINFWAVWIVLS